MFRRSSDSKNSGDYNWRRLWEPPSMKSQRRYARAWVNPLLGDLPLHEVLVVSAHPPGPLDSVTMSSNPANQPIEDPFLRWSQEMEAKQEEQARQMVELREHENCLQQENKRLLAHLETNGVENPQGAAQPIPLTQADKGKGPALPNHSDHPVDDELSSDSSPLPRHSPSQNNAEVESRKRPPLQSSRAVSVVHRRTRREASRDRPRSELAPEYISARLRAWPPSFCLRNTSSGHLLPCVQHFIPLSGGRMTCCLPPWASIFWTMSLLADFSFHRLLCTMAPLIRMIICCTLTRQ